MAQQNKSPKLFTVEEANQLLPQVRQTLKDLRNRREDIRKIEQKIAVEELTWLRKDGTVDPKAEEQLSRLKKMLDEMVNTFGQGFERLNALGAQLKDLDEGLVDFFMVRGNTLVYLCWKEGEDRIRFWHDMESGFPGRQPLEENEITR